jgi:hypothetical protein
MNEVLKLTEKLTDFAYHSSMVIIKNEITGRAFFPGGNGTFNHDTNLNDKDIMILGQDFDCLKNYNKSFKLQLEKIETNPTWKNILLFLKELNINSDRCFFANAILGARNSEKATGKSPAFKDKIFINNCRNFFLYQVELQKPKIILVLGIHVATFLSNTSKDLECWNKIKNFKDLDAENIQKINAVFNNGVKSNVILLTHPSFRNLNVNRRKYKNYIGHDAEIQMVKEAIESKPE